MTDPATRFGERVANELIENEQWARERLRAHAGRSFLLRSGPLATSYSITAEGTLQAHSAQGTAADLELDLSPFDLPLLLAHPDRWETLVASRGDEALAATLKELSTTLPWFVERGFARAFGPIVGQRLADAGRALLAFPDYAQTQLADNVMSFARDESGLAVRQDELQALADDHGALAERVDRLIERLDRL